MSSKRQTAIFHKNSVNSDTPFIPRDLQDLYDLYKLTNLFRAEDSSLEEYTITNAILMVD